MSLADWQKALSGPGLVNDRQKTHGDYAHTARVTNDLRAIIRSTEPVKLNDQQRDALEHICCKMARILCGDPNHADHWSDIAGYAALAKDSIPLT